MTLVKRNLLDVGEYSVSNKMVVGKVHLKQLFLPKLHNKRDCLISVTPIRVNNNYLKAHLKIFTNFLNFMTNAKTFCRVLF